MKSYACKTIFDQNEARPCHTTKVLVAHINLTMHDGSTFLIIGNLQVITEMNAITISNLAQFHAVRQCTYI